MNVLLVFLALAMISGLRAGTRTRRPSASVMVAGAAVVTVLLFNLRWV